jgi:hypothetical protein
MALTAMLFLEESDVGPLPKSTGSEQPTITRGPGTRDVVQPIRDDTTWSSGQIDPIDNTLDFRKLFDRVALPDERYDDEWIEALDDMIRSEGRLVGRQEWDSSGPGAGADTVYVYQFRGVFISDDELVRPVRNLC